MNPLRLRDRVRSSGFSPSGAGVAAACGLGGSLSAGAGGGSGAVARDDTAGFDAAAAIGFAGAAPAVDGVLGLTVALSVVGFSLASRTRAGGVGVAGFAGASAGLSISVAFAC